MDRETLTRLSEDEKIELILRLEARIAALEGPLKRPVKTPENSSIPASRQPKATTPKKNAQKRGPKLGHSGSSRERSMADLTIDLRVETCQCCGVDLRQVSQQECGRSQVVELPPITPIVIEAVSYGLTCPGCGQHQQAPYPPGLEAERVFGPNIEALATYLRQGHHLSFARLQEVFESVFSLAISQGALNNILQRVAQHLQPAVDQIKQQVIHSPVVGSDETSARVDGHNHWEWVFQTPTASYHTVQPTRSTTVIDQVLGDCRVEVWVADLYSAQRKGASTHADQFSMCGAHQLRDLQFAIDAGDSVFAPAFRRLLLEAKALADYRDHLPSTTYTELVACVQATCDSLLTLETTVDAGRNLQRRYTQHRQSIFVFLDHPTVPFDNNASERALRNSVIHRKVTGGFRSDQGAAAFAAVTTIIQTARKQGLAILDTLRSLLTPSPLLADP